MRGFDLLVRDGVVLRLAEARFAAAAHAMTERNQARLARWERWAETPSTLDGTGAWMRSQPDAFAAGTAVPLLLLEGDELVGSVGVRLDPGRRDGLGRLEGLGCTLHGTLRAAVRRGDERVDQCGSTLLADELAESP